MATYLFLLTPLFTAIIGWATNWLAVKMLFHPRKPLRLPFLNWQGLIPKRQQQLATEAAEIIEREILQQHLILSEIKKIELSPYLEKTAKSLVWERIGPQLQSIPLLGGFVNDGVLEKFESIAIEEIKKESSPLIEQVASEFESSVDLKRLIKDNIAAFDLDRLEQIVNQVARREFQTIEYIGAILGFLIGCIQVILFWQYGSFTF